MAGLRKVASDLSSRSSTGLEDCVRIRLHFGGYWALQEDNTWQYVDGETYLEKLSWDVKYADLMHMVNEKINGSAVFKYTPPGEHLSPDNLVTVVDDAHLQEMFDLIQEHKEALKMHDLRGKKFRLHVWLSRASEEEVTLDDIFMKGNASETGASNVSDGTQSPLLRYSKWSDLTNPVGNTDDADMQARVAEEDCNYLNAMEVEESIEASQSQYQYPLTQLSSDDWTLVPNSNDIYGEADPKEMMDSSTPSQVDVSSQDPSTPDPDTPPLNQQKAFRLPSSLGFSLGNANDRSIAFRLPSKLGSSLGNSKAGTLSDLNPSHLTRATYRVPALPPSTILESPAFPSSANTQEDLLPRRTTPNGTPIPPGTGMDHFHSVPASQLLPIGKLGEGSFGQVLKCTNVLFGDVAVKCAKAEGDQDFFSQEVRMLSSLNHPNVLRFFGVVVDDRKESQVVGVMTEFMQGRSLSTYLGPESPRGSLLERAKLAKGAVNGLMYLHKHNIIHYDVKPENLLLDYPPFSGNFTPGIKVADFGLSRYKFDVSAADLCLRGTLPYMAPEIAAAPEVAMERSKVTEKADIWSLGMVLWEMFTHRVPYGNMTAPEITALLRSGNAFPDIPWDMERDWAALVEVCCRSDPHHRFCLDNIAAMLDQIIQHETARGPIY